MGFLSTFILLSFFVLGVLSNQILHLSSDNKEKSDIDNQPIATSSASEENIQKTEETKEFNLENAPPTPISGDDSINLNPSSQIDAFIYPNAILISKSEIKIILNSSDNPDEITKWYEQKIKSLSLNTTSFVKTKTNDDVLNKLVAASEQRKVSVEIEKSHQENITKITVEYSE